MHETGLELTQRGDELHAICTGILYCPNLWIAQGWDTNMSIGLLLYWPPNPAHSAHFSISLISVLRLNLAREILVLDSDAAISSGNSGPETCGMRRVQTQVCHSQLGTVEMVRSDQPS